MDNIKNVNKKFNILLVVLSVLLIVTFFISMCVGRYGVSIGEVFKFFTGQKIDQTSYNVMLYLRLPRTLIAVLVGIALTLSGAIYQSAFNNRLVSIKGLFIRLDRDKDSDTLDSSSKNELIISNLILILS